MAAAPFIPSIEHKWGLVRLSTQQQWLGLTEREIVLVLTTINPAAYREWLIWQNPQKEWSILDDFLKSGQHEFQYKIPDSKEKLPPVATGLMKSGSRQSSEEQSSQDMENTAPAYNSGSPAPVQKISRAIPIRSNAPFSKKMEDPASILKDSSDEVTVASDESAGRKRVTLEETGRLKIIENVADLNSILRPADKNKSFKIKGKK